MNKENDLLAYCPKKKGCVAKHLPYLSLSECADLVTAYIYKDRDKFDTVVEHNLHKGTYNAAAKFSYKEIEVMLQNYKANYEKLMSKFPDEHFRSDVVKMLHILLAKASIYDASTTERYESLRLSILLHLKEGLKIASPENFFRAEYHCDLRYAKDDNGKWKIYGAKVDKHGLPIISFDCYFNESISHRTLSEMFWNSFTSKSILKHLLIAIIIVAIAIPIGVFFANLGFFILVIIWLVLGILKELTGRNGF